MGKLDTERFVTVMLPIARTAFERVLTKHKADKFYAVGFAIPTDEGPPILVANTEAALLHYARTTGVELGLGPTEGDRIEGSRWGVGDWKYIAFLLRHERKLLMRELPPEASEEDAELRQQTADGCAKVLCALDKEGLFGKETRRDDLCVSVFSDLFEEETWEKYVRLLNPLAVAQRHVHDWELRKQREKELETWYAEQAAIAQQQAQGWRETKDALPRMEPAEREFCEHVLKALHRNDPEQRVLEVIGEGCRRADTGTLVTYIKQVELGDRVDRFVIVIDKKRGLYQVRLDGGYGRFTYVAD